MMGRGNNARISDSQSTLGKDFLIQHFVIKLMSLRSSKAVKDVSTFSHLYNPGTEAERLTVFDVGSKI